VRKGCRTSVLMALEMEVKLRKNPLSLVFYGAKYAVCMIWKRNTGTV